jgi:hypothetical protein
MVSKALAFEGTALFDAQFAAVNQFLQQLCMVNYFIITAQVGIFIFQGIEAVGASGYDFLHPVHIERFYIADGLHLKQKFIASTTGRVAGAVLFCAQYGKLNAHLVQYLADGSSYFFVSFVERAGAAYPKNDFGALALCLQFG